MAKILDALTKALFGHDRAKSEAWTCPCVLCAAANPDKLTPADREAKTHRARQCGKQMPDGKRCARAFVHAGRCLP